MSGRRPDVVIILTDQERAAPPYETEELRRWRYQALPGRHWFDGNGVSFNRHYTGSLACVPSRPTIFTGQFPDVHGVTQTDVPATIMTSDWRGLGRNMTPSLSRS